MIDGATQFSGFTEVASPALFPAFVHRCSVVVDGAGPDLAGPGLPDELRTAVESRRREFLAGRHCAAHALARLDPVLAATPVSRGAARQPEWPAAVTGSITHTGMFASAAVARTADVRSLGLDTERLERFGPLSRASRLVLRPEEADLGGAALSDRRLPLVFSAKEAVFKCLYPLVGRHFYFQSAVLEAIDPAAGTFIARPAGDLAPGVDSSLRLEGRFCFDADYVHTGVWLPR